MFIKSLRNFYKTAAKYLTVCFGTLILTFSLTTNCYPEETIYISTEEYPPHTSSILKFNGLNCRIVTEAFALEGIAVKYGFFPAKRSYYKAQVGEVDASLPWVWRKDRAEDFYYTDPVVTAGVNSFFHLKSYKVDWDADKRDYTQLSGIKIGGVIGHNYEKTFQDAEKSGLIQVERLSTVKQNFQKLLIGRIQLYIIADIVGLYELQSNFEPYEVDLVTYTRENNRPAGKYHLIISKKSKKGKYFLEAFNRGLKMLKESGDYDIFLEESKGGKYIMK